MNNITVHNPHNQQFNPALYMNSRLRYQKHKLSKSNTKNSSQIINDQISPWSQINYKMDSIIMPNIKTIDTTNSISKISERDAQSIHTTMSIKRSNQNSRVKRQIKMSRYSEIVESDQKLVNIDLSAQKIKPQLLGIDKLPPQLTESGMLSHHDTGHLLMPQYEQLQANNYISMQFNSNVQKQSNNRFRRNYFSRNKYNNNTNTSEQFNLNRSVEIPSAQNKLKTYQLNYFNKIQVIKTKIQNLKNQRAIALTHDFRDQSQKKLIKSQDNQSLQKRIVYHKPKSMYLQNLIKKRNIQSQESHRSEMSPSKSSKSNVISRIMDETHQSKASIEMDTEETTHNEKIQNIQFLQDLYSDLSDKKNKTSLVERSLNQYRTIFKKQDIKQFEQPKHSIMSIGKQNLKEIIQDEHQFERKSSYLELVKNKIMGRNDKNKIMNKNKSNLNSRNQTRNYQYDSQIIPRNTSPMSMFAANNDSLVMRDNFMNEPQNQSIKLIHKKGLSFQDKITKTDIKQTYSEVSQSFRKNLYNQYNQFDKDMNQRNIQDVSSQLQTLKFNDVQNNSEYRSLAVRRQRLILAQKLKSKQRNIQNVDISGFFPEFIRNNIKELSPVLKKASMNSYNMEIERFEESMQPLRLSQQPKEKDFIRQYKNLDLRSRIESRDFNFKQKEVNRSLNFANEFRSIL
ncbi:UNKNOWN [Stylonychia lemnae]|uniref:Uncharacterized protein n=1 Tax=Stylonychia lemnae TaxID=5949 RepID=A0A078AE51_STYLE|nr:UNKNOWN [Stylonychia lemnae]|eukprot:CDW80116.1 UNKNOWN [Stylonychia lemnae]